MKLGIFSERECAAASTALSPVGLETANDGEPATAYVFRACSTRHLEAWGIGRGVDS